MLTKDQKNFLNKTGVNQTLSNLLYNVRERRSIREHSAQVLTNYRNYQRTKNAYNALHKKELNLRMNLIIHERRLRDMHRYRESLFHGRPDNVSQAMLRNRIQNLPRNVPKTVNMKEFVRRLNAYEAVKPTALNSGKAHLAATVKFITSMSPYGFNNRVYNLKKLNTMAELLSRKLKYNKGRVIGTIVGNRATNPHTVVGRRMIMKGYPGN
jgi:hypothetical protein